MGGHIDFLTMGATPALAQQSAVRMIAVTTTKRSRLPGLDRLPTIAETLVPGFDFSLWQAVFAPARVPDPVVATLNAQFREILAMEAVRAALADVGADVVSGSPEDAERIFRAEAERFRRHAQR